MSHAVHAVAADLPALTSVLVDAFADDPVQRWLFEPAERPDVARRAMFDIFVEDYFWLGHTHVAAGTGGVTGAALWAPPDRNPLQGDRIQVLLGALEAHLGDETVPRLSELARAAEYRPPVPHFYLGILGVDPDQQSHGIGTRLLEPGLAESDRCGMVAHLESSNPRNIPFYERHGFVVSSDYRCGGRKGPLMTIMTRQPR